MDDGYYSDGLGNSDKEHGRTYKIIRGIFFGFLTALVILFAVVFIIRLQSVNPPIEATKILPTANNANADDFVSIKSKTKDVKDPDNPLISYFEATVVEYSNQSTERDVKEDNDGVIDEDAYKYSFYSTHPSLYKKFTVMEFVYSPSCNEVQLILRYNQGTIDYLNESLTEPGKTHELSFALRRDIYDAEGKVRDSYFYDPPQSAHFEKMRNGFYRLAFDKVVLEDLTNLKLCIYWDEEELNIGEIPIYTFTRTATEIGEAK